MNGVKQLLAGSRMLLPRLFPTLAGLRVYFNAHAFDRASAEPTIKKLMQHAGYVGSGVFSVQDVKPFRQCKGTRVLLDLHPIDERNLLRNCLRKKDGKQWRSVIENVEAYTIDPEFIIRRDEPMLSLRRVMAAKFGLQTDEVKFDKATDEQKGKVRAENVPAAAGDSHCGVFQTLHALLKEFNGSPMANQNLRSSFR